MPFLDHLEELRKVVLLCLLVVSVFTIFGWFISKDMMTLMVKPIGKAVFLSPTEAFSTRLKLSIIAGVLVSLPFLSFKVWSFIAPGLLESERSLLFPLVVLSTVFFLSGVLFGYFILVPMIVKVLVGFGGPSVSPMISVSSYLGFVTKLCIAMALVFQLPVLASTLTWLGIISPEFLTEKWRYMIAGIFVLGAVATPGGDVISQLAMAVPVLALYGISIIFSILVSRKKNGEKNGVRSSNFT